jgi:hypothetical protein
MKKYLAVSVLVIAAFGLSIPSRAQGVPHFNTLNWTRSTTPGLTSQRVWRSTTPGGPYTNIATIPDGTTVTYQDNNVTQGVKHYYVLTALVGTNESVFTGEVNVTDVGTNVNPQSGLTVTGQ